MLEWCESACVAKSVVVPVELDYCLMQVVFHRLDFEEFVI